MSSSTSDVGEPRFYNAWLSPAARERLAVASFYFTFASAVAILFSIAISQALLGLALAALFLSGRRLRLPRIWLPLALFLLGTLISLAFSPDPRAGMPQVRKIYVYFTLLVTYSNFLETVAARRLVLYWSATGALSVSLGLVQFARKFLAARAIHQDFYQYYTGSRITGFMSHWMTFSGEEMLVMIMLLAWLLFAPGVFDQGGAGRSSVGNGGKVKPRRDWVWIICFFAIGLGLLLGETRSMWIAGGLATIVLLWFWNWRVAAVTPLLLVAIGWFSPGGVHERFVSLWRPQGVDSNDFRTITWRTGLRMIAAHPWLGLGPEEVRAQFMDWVPPEIPRLPDGKPQLPTGWYGHLHNIYLQYAAERGIPTMLALLWMLVQTLWDFGRGIVLAGRARSDVRFLLTGSFASVLALMIGGLFEHNLGDSEVLTMFLVITALGYLALDRLPVSLGLGAPAVRALDDAH